MGAGKGLEIVKEVQKDLFAALGKPLLEFTAVEQKKKRLVTTHGELNLFTLGAFAVGAAVAAWLMGVGLSPVSTTDANGNTRTGVQIVERPRLLLPFTSSAAGTGSGGIGLPVSWNPITGILPLISPALLAGPAVTGH